MALYVRYPLYSWKHNFEELYAPCPILVGTLCYVQGTPFFLFFFTPVLLLKNIAAIMKNFSAIKRVVKHEKMAIYVRYPLYSWKHNLKNFMPLTPSIVETLCYVRGTLFFSFFFFFSFYEKVALYAGYPLYSWKHNFEELYAPCPILVGTLCYVRGTPFFLFFLPQFYC